jgi:hypothetical protein
MVSVSQVFLRGSQFLWTLLITALVGNVIATAFAGNPSSINYAIFVAVFSWVVLLYGFAAAFMEGLAIPIVLGALDLLATLFTFIAGVVLAADLHVHSCSNFVSTIPAIDFRVVPNNVAGIHQHQQPYQRLAQRSKAMQRTSGQHSILLVPVRLLRWIPCHGLCQSWILDVVPTKRWHPQRWAIHVPGLNGNW